MRKLLFRLILGGVLFGVSKANAQGAAAESLLIFSTEQGVNKADSNTTYTIKDVFISGNSKTKDAIILRELPFTINKSYPLDVIVSRFYHAKQQLMNTGLFRDVIVSLRSLMDHDVYVQIDVEEKWYFYPIPFVRMVDDNYSELWKGSGNKLDKVNYGIRLTHDNLTGRNDKLHAYLMNGYTKQLSLEYKGLYLDKSYKWYTNIGLAYGLNREVNYMTEYNKKVPVKDPNGYMRSFSNATLELAYRPAIKSRHIFSIGYFYETVADTISKLNRNFSSSSTISYPTVGYTFAYSDVDFIPYPTKGIFGDLSLMKYGIGSAINMWQLSARTSISWPVGVNNFLNLKAVGLVKLPFKQPYITQQFLGNGNLFMQGYEDYVIDGVGGGYAKLSFHHPIINTSLRIPENTVTNKLKLFKPVPIKVFAKAFGNMGYVYNPNYVPYNQLNNKALYSAGVGLDIVAFADLIFKVEWSINQLGQNGIYLHQRETY
jgi:outer membrane protein assembly factor BamA